MATIGKIYFFSLIFLFIFVSSALSQNSYNLKHFRNNKKEGFYYLLQLKKLYPLLWGADADSLKKISYKRMNKDETANCNYKFEEIEKNGYIATKLKEAEKQKLFDILGKAYKASSQNPCIPNQNPFNLSRKSWSFAIEDDFKAFCSLRIIKRVYPYKIWLNAKNKKWNRVVYDLKIWLHPGVLTKEYAFYMPVLEYMFYLLQRHDMSRTTIRKILKLNEYVINNPPIRKTDWATDTAILNIIVAELLLYKRYNMVFPEKLSQIESLKHYLAKLTKKIIYESNGRTWALKYQSDTITKGKQCTPFYGFLTDRKKEYTNKDGELGSTTVEKIEKIVNGKKKVLYKSTIVTYDKNGKEIITTKVSDKNPNNEGRSQKPMVIIAYDKIMVIDKNGAKTYNVKPENVEAVAYYLQVLFCLLYLN